MRAVAVVLSLFISIAVWGSGLNQFLSPKLFSVETLGEVKFGSTSSSCGASTEGQQRYNSAAKRMEFCNGSAWSGYGSGTSALIPLGTITAFAGAAAPTGWMICDGAVLSAAAYPDLFALLGATYGGDGTTNFALPDLKGRFPVGVNPTAGALSSTLLGQVGGREDVMLMTNNLPMHTHPMTALGIQLGGSPGSSGVPLSGDGASNSTVPLSAGFTGWGMPIDIRPPYTGVNYIIYVGPN